MNIKQLTKLGLTIAESIIYTTVLKIGTCTVKQISKECGFHRTNIYDVLEKLKEKGLITFHKEGKVNKYNVSDPNNLYAFLEEKEELLTSLFPEIKKLHKQSSEEIQVEIYKGNEGMKSAWRDILKHGKEIYGFGLKGQLREKLPIFGEQWLLQAEKRKIKSFGIFTQRKNMPNYITEARFVSQELSGPVATIIYGDKININIWEPSLTAVVIKSKLVAQMYKKHFDLLWKIAKK
jgi:sugar-specific transcriptional regulator TrmB